LTAFSSYCGIEVFQEFFLVLLFIFLRHPLPVIPFVIAHPNQNSWLICSTITLSPGFAFIISSPLRSFAISSFICGYWAEDQPENELNDRIALNTNTVC